LRLNTAVFHSTLQDMQLVFGGASGNPTVSQAYNAGRATIQGMELEIEWAPAPDLEWAVNYTYLNAYVDHVDVIAGTNFDQTANPGSPYRVGNNISAVFVVPFTPRHSIDLAADYTFGHFERSALAAHLDYRWQAAYSANAPGGRAVGRRDYNRAPSYGLLNGRLTLTLDLPRDDVATLSLWGKNLAQKRYKAQISPQNQGGVPIGTRDLQTGEMTITNNGAFTPAATTWGEPLSVGIAVTYEY
jgi:iron complex outermembrane receptor protein